MKLLSTPLSSSSSSTVPLLTSSSSPFLSSSSTSFTYTNDFHKYSIYTKWQHENDLPLRRIILNSIVHLLLERLHLSLDTDEKWSCLFAYAQRLEYEMYCIAGSLEEYRDKTTLLPRYLYVASILFHQRFLIKKKGGKETLPLRPTFSSSRPTFSRPTFSPSSSFLLQRPSFRLEDETLHYSKKRKYEDMIIYPSKRRLQQLQPWQLPSLHKSSHKGYFFFPNESNDVLYLITEYLTTYDLLQLQSCEKQAYVYFATFVREITYNLAMINVDKMSTIFEVLQRYPQLQHLEIIYQPISTSSKLPISKSFDYLRQNYGKYRAIDIQRLHITMIPPYQIDQLLISLGHALLLGYGANLKSLSCYTIFHEFSSSFSWIYQNQDHIKKLAVTNAFNSLQLITEALCHGKCPLLQNLRFAGCSLGDYGMIELTDIFRSGQCPYLECLDLRCNYIGEKGMKAFYESLQTSNSNLKYLLLGGNLLSDCCMPYLANLIEVGALPLLEILALDYNYLQQNGILKILHAISTLQCRKLRHLDFGGNNTQNAALQIAELVQTNKCPNLMLINAGNVSENGAKCIDRALQIRRQIIAMTQ